MGYTHYWIRPVEIDKEIFKTIKEEMEIAIERLPVVIGNGAGDEKFKPENDCIIFNGYGNDDSHETFYFPQKGASVELYTDRPFNEKRVLEFCKTGKKPYDLVVMVCLLIAKWHLKSDISISSDGDSKDWETGFNAYKWIFGEDRLAALKAYISLSDDDDFDFLKEEGGNH